MRKLKSVGGYDLVYSELDKDYEIYQGEDFIASFETEAEATKELEALFGQSEILENER